MEYNSKTIFCFFLPLIFMLSVGAAEKYTCTPSHYKLEIITTDDNFKDEEKGYNDRYDGQVNIEFTMNKPEKEVENVDIVLNTNPGTKLNGCILKGQSGEEWKDIEIEGNVNKDKLIINVPKIDASYKVFQLTVDYSNPLSKDLNGLYRSSYVPKSSNQSSWLLATHFEPIYARNAFPCFDYPNLKAVFEIDFFVPKDKVVLCNTPTTSQDYGENKQVSCKATLPMSTYLVAFTISDFIGTEPVTFTSDYPSESERTLRTYGRKDIIKNGDGDFAQKMGRAAIVGLSKYLGIGYAFDKIDQVGIPDFSAGAMENWGHISFREKALFFNSKTGSPNTKQSITLTITHELVHQWFGNLVTLESWDYIWLNEGFANYLEYVIASKFQDTQDWELMKQFVVDEIHMRAFEIDGLNSAKPLNDNITDESLILPSFNDIPYAKGSAVLRMWENALGSDKFQKSLHQYLKERALKPANPTQLYSFFKKEANMKEEFFFSWTNNAGYPLVDVKRNKEGTYTLTQKRFFWNSGLKSDTKYAVPITYASNVLNHWETGNPKWLNDQPLVLNITGKWIVVNNKQSGYYRVNYDQENWDALAEVLDKNFKAINELNRAQIINDVFSLARSLQDNYVRYQTALHLAKYLTKETSFYPWKTALNSFNFVRTKLREGPVLDSFHEYVLSLITPHFKSLISKTTNHIERLKNIAISSWACSLGLDKCVKEAQQLYKDSKYSSHPDVQEIILCTAVRHLDAWDEIFKKYVEEQDSALKITYIRALGCTNDAAKANELLKKTLAEDNVIRKQDRIFALSAVHDGNLKHIGLAFKFIEENFKTIAQMYGGMDPLGGALVGIARKLNDPSEHNRLAELGEKIKADEDGKAARESFENALNIARSNTEWVNQRMIQFRQYFKSAGSLATYSLGLLSLCLVIVFQF